MSLQIFNPHGGVDFVPMPDGAKIFFTLTEPIEPSPNPETPSKSKGPNALFASMPVSGLSIDQAVDMNITKTLNKDFMVSEFGDTPVQISMNGVNFYGDTCGIYGKENEQVLDFYEKYKLSNNPKARLCLSMTDEKTSNGNFICVLIKMRTIGPASDKNGTVPLYSYNLTLIGVRR